MAALWMVGLEDQPERCAEICIMEVFVTPWFPETRWVERGCSSGGVKYTCPAPTLW
jgi:hypothetical protein